MKITKVMAGFALIAMLSTNATAQQLKTPAPSPSQTIKQAFGLGEITIDYSRPSVKGRTIFGDVVPFGKVWRTGANASTKLTFSDDVSLDGNAVKAGTYALYTVPNKDSWEVMLYKDLSLGGNVADYKAENEVLRFKTTSMAAPIKVETFTITLAEVMPTAATLEIVWEATKISVKVATSIDEKIMKNITAAMSPVDARPYFAAASYYYDNGKDLNKALEWANKAIEQNPKAFWISHLKAKILLKNKDYKNAIAIAEQSLATAKTEKNEDYVKMNEKLIVDAKKGK